jgi:precorrin isomerase
MKKLFAFSLFALSFTALQAQSTVVFDVQDGKKGIGRVASIHSDGSATLIDDNTGELKHVIMDNEYGAVIVGVPVEFVEITTAEGKVITVAIGNVDSAVNLRL